MLSLILCTLCIKSMAIELGLGSESGLPVTALGGVTTLATCRATAI